MANLVEIDAFEIKTKQRGSRVPAWVIAVPSQTFTDANDRVVIGGEFPSDNPNWFQKVAVTEVSDGKWQTATFTGDNKLSATSWDAVGETGVTYTFYLTTDNYKVLQILYSSISIPDTLTTTTIADLDKLRSAKKFRKVFSYLTLEQWYAWRDSLISSLTKATTLVWGAVRVDTVPDDVADPEVVGVNSARLTKVLSADYSNSLATAITDIGADDVDVIVKVNTNASSALVVPDNILLIQQDSALIIESGTGSIEFEGQGVADPMSRTPFFQGFEAGDITWTGDVYPAKVSTELFDTGNTSLTDRIKMLDEALDGKYSTIVCFPRIITGNCFAGTSMNDGHSLYFTKGDYQNTANTKATTSLPPFVMGSYSSFTSEPGAIIYESSVALNTYIVQSKIGAVECYIEHNHFKGQGTTFDSFSSTAILSSATDSHIRYNIFDGCNAYHAGIVRQGVQTNNRNCSITHNICKGFMSQLIYITSGEGCSLSFNIIDLEDATGLNQFSAMDIEPNHPTDFIQDLTVQGNQINLRGINQGATGIFVQGNSTRNLKNVTVCGNRVIGGDTGLDSNLISGIDVYGIDGLKIYDNETIAPYSYAYSVLACKNVKFYDNDSRYGGDVRSNLAALYVVAVRDGQFISNTFNHNTAPTFATKIYEAEQEKTVTSSGATITATTENPEFYELWIGGTVILNNTETEVTAANTLSSPQTLTVSPSIGTLAVKTFTSANVTAGTDNIAITSHGHITGSRVRLSTTGVLPAHTAPASDSITGLKTYFVIRVDANNIKLASSLANAVALTAIDLTDGGTGTHTVTPILITKFSNSTYKENDADDVRLEPTATQDRVYSQYDDKFADKQNVDADLTAIAGLTPSNDDFMVRVAGSWANRTGAQVKTLLAIVVANISDFAAGVRAVVLTGLSLATSTAVSATDTVLEAIGKLQAQVTLKAPKASPTFTGTPEIAAATGTSLVLSGAASAASLNLGGATLLDILTATAALNFDLTAVESEELTIALPGAVVGDSVSLGVPAGSTADTSFFAFVSAADVVTVKATRVFGTTPNPASGTFRVTILKF